MLMKKKAHKDSPCFKTIMSKQIIQAKILIKGKEMQDCDVASREGVIRAIIAWLNGCFLGRNPEKRVFWINGERNCGKSMITHYIAKLCHDKHALAAGYVFQDGFNESKWSGLTGTLASDFIAHFGIGYRASLIEKAEALTCDVNEFLAQPPDIQFEYLLTGAWKDIADTKRQPMIMVLDDLDRCDDWTIRYICDLIQVSISRKANMPVYWVVSSCDTPYIRSHMLNGQLSEHVESYTLPLYEPGDVVDAESDDPPDTPTPDQSFNTKTPTSASFSIPSLPHAEDDEEQVPLVSAYGALYGRDEELRRTDSSSSSYELESMGSVSESDDE
jgi:KAP family P-loop domain